MKSRLLWVCALLLVCGGWLVARGLDVEAEAGSIPLGWTAYTPLSDNGGAYQSSLSLTFDDGFGARSVVVPEDITGYSAFLKDMSEDGIVRIFPDEAANPKALNAFERVMVDLGLILAGLAVIALIADLTLRSWHRASSTVSRRPEL